MNYGSCGGRSYRCLIATSRPDTEGHNPGMGKQRWLTGTMRIYGYCIWQVGVYQVLANTICLSPIVLPAVNKHARHGPRHGSNSGHCCIRARSPILILPEWQIASEHPGSLMMESAYGIKGRWLPVPRDPNGLPCLRWPQTMMQTRGISRSISTSKCPPPSISCSPHSLTGLRCFSSLSSLQLHRV